MRNLLLSAMICLLGVPAMAQLNCNTLNPSISTSVSQATVTVTNSSTPTATSTLYTTYYFNWGDGSNITIKHNNSNAVHTYNNSGTYTIQMIQAVLDSTSNTSCHDTTTATVSVTVPPLNCGNVNSFFSISTNGSVATFTNASSPTGNNNILTSYNIDWGDNSSTTTGNSSAMINHIYSSSGVYTVLLTGTWHDTANNVGPCTDTFSKTFTITTSAGTQLNCDSVRAALAVNSNPSMGLTVSAAFNGTVNTNASITESVVINWGDNSTSTPGVSSGNITHTYTGPGSYTVTMFYTVTDTVNNITCQDSAFQNINIQNIITGYVVPDSQLYSQYDSFDVWLITYDSSTNILAAVDSQRVSAYYSAFRFYNKANGQYRLKAALHNGPTSGTTMVPTYHTSSLMWNNATVINHTGFSVNKNIFMQVGTATSGPGFIGGNVNQGANKGTASGIAGMNILLLDGTGNLVAYTVTDANGHYSFSNLPAITYQVHPEDIGYATTASTIIVDGNKPTHNAINFERSLSQQTIVPKATGIENVNSDIAYTIFPNPAKDVVYINWGTASQDVAAVTITDISGKKVLVSEVLMGSNTTVDIHNLHSGLYFLTVATEAGSTTQKLILE